MLEVQWLVLIMSNHEYYLSEHKKKKNASLKKNCRSQVCREGYLYDAVTAMTNVLFIHNMLSVQAVAMNHGRKFVAARPCYLGHWGDW